MKLYCALLIAAVAVSCTAFDEEKLEKREDDNELEKRCHGSFKGALLEKRSLKDLAELSEVFKRCVIGGSGKVRVEKRDDELEVFKRCHGNWKGALIEKRSLQDLAELSEVFKRCVIGGSRSTGKV